MNPYTILVEFELKDGAADAFVELVRDNARASLATEPGCRRFDVLRESSRPDRIVLYEIYDDASAFARHLETPHIKAFNDASRELVLDKQVTELQLVPA